MKLKLKSETKIDLQNRISADITTRVLFQDSIALAHLEQKKPRQAPDPEERTFATGPPRDQTDHHPGPRHLRERPQLPQRRPLQPERGLLRGQREPGGPEPQETLLAPQELLHLPHQQQQPEVAQVAAVVLARGEPAPAAAEAGGSGGPDTAESAAGHVPPEVPVRRAGVRGQLGTGVLQAPDPPGAGLDQEGEGEFEESEGVVPAEAEGA